MADEADRELAGLEQAAPRRAEVAFLRAYVSLKRGQLRGGDQRRPPGPAPAHDRIPRRGWYWPRRCSCRGRPTRVAGRPKHFLDEAPPSMERERREAEKFLNR